MSHPDPSDVHCLPTYTPSTRPPPPSGSPPAYATALTRVYPYTLRPVILFTSFITFLYLILVGISNFQYVGDEGSTAKMNTFDIVQGALFVTIAAIEVVGFAGALKNNLKIATMYSKLTLPAYLMAIAAQVIGVAAHYSLKDDEVVACTSRNTGETVRTGVSGFWWDTNSGSTVTLTEQQAREYCTDRWSSGSTWQIVWLVITVILGVPFVLFSFAYVRQLRDPTSVRVRVRSNWGWGSNTQQAPSAQYPYDPQAQAYAMRPYPATYAPPPGPPPPSNQPPKYARRDSDQDDYDDHKTGPSS